MKFYYRFSHTEAKLLQKIPTLFYGVSIKGTTMAKYGGLAALFINGTKKPYFIDPHTFHLNFSNESHKKLAGIYGFQQPLQHHEFTDENKRKLLETNVISFERNSINNLLASTASELEEVSEKFYPEFLIAPYFIMSETLGSLDLNITLIEESKGLLQKGEKLYAQICLTKETLMSKTTLDKILEKYSALKIVDGYTFWIQHFDEYSLSEDNLSNLKSFMQKLAETKKPIINLYGGFYSMLLSDYGLIGVSHTLAGGEKQDIILCQEKVGGGRPPTRYYISSLKRKFPQATIDVLKTKAPEFLNCQCQYCTTQALGDREKTLLHFATKRKEEIDKINSKYNFKQEIDTTFKKYGKKLFPAVNLGYLQRWVSALNS